ncbi:hypothetical protein [Corallococcus sp. ZKHCc1 1396]
MPRPTMSIDFTCQKCEASFELEAQDLIEGTEKIICPHCDSKAPANLSEDFVAALTEMRAQIATLSKKYFAVTLALEAEELEDEIDDDDDDADEEAEDDDLDEDEDDEESEDDEDYDDEAEDEEQDR